MDGWRGSEGLNLTVGSLIAGSWATEQLFIALTWVPEDFSRVTCDAPLLRAELKGNTAEDLRPTRASA
jgi:hypothetical protein